MAKEKRSEDTRQLTRKDKEKRKKTKEKKKRSRGNGGRGKEGGAARSTMLRSLSDISTTDSRNYRSFRPMINAVEGAEWLFAAQGGMHSTGPVRKQTVEHSGERH